MRHISIALGTTVKHATKIAHSCGHTTEHRLHHVPPSERANERRKLAATRCHSCQAAAKQRAVEEANRGLPILVGDHVTDAMRIRGVLLPQIQGALDEQVAIIRRQLDKRTINDNEATLLTAWHEEGYKLIERQKRADWWTQRRLHHPRTLLLRATKHVIDREQLP